MDGLLIDLTTAVERARRVADKRMGSIATCIDWKPFLEYEVRNQLAYRELPDETPMMEILGEMGVGYDYIQDIRYELIEGIRQVIALTGLNREHDWEVTFLSEELDDGYEVRFKDLGSAEVRELLQELIDMEQEKIGIGKTSPRLMELRARLGA